MEAMRPAGRLSVVCILSALLHASLPAAATTIDDVGEGGWGGLRGRPGVDGGSGVGCGGDELAGLVPPPQRVTCTAGAQPLHLTRDWRIVAAPTHAAAAALLAARLSAEAGLNLPLVTDVAGVNASAEKVVVLGVPEAEPAIAAIAGPAALSKMSPLPDGNEEGYLLDLTVAGRNRVILMLGRGPAGVFWAAQTLAQAVANRTSSDGAALPRCAVLDYPDVAIRGFRAWAAPIDQNNVSWTRGLVDLMSSYKLNFAPLPANAWHSQPARERPPPLPHRQLPPHPTPKPRPPAGPGLAHDQRAAARRLRDGDARGGPLLPAAGQAAHGRPFR